MICRNLICRVDNFFYTIMMDHQREKGKTTGKKVMEVVPLLIVEEQDLKKIRVKRENTSEIVKL